MRSHRKPILAIDPGNIHSAYIAYLNGEIVAMGKIANDEMLQLLMNELSPSDYDVLVIEMIASYGMPVGKEVFETCVWIGRFLQAWNGRCEFIYRKDIKLHLCGTSRAKDPNVRQALLDRFPATGGGKLPQVGTKSSPGPLYGIHNDIWSALAVAVYAYDNEVSKAV